MSACRWRTSEARLATGPASAHLEVKLRRYLYDKIFDRARRIQSALLFMDHAQRVEGWRCVIQKRADGSRHMPPCRDDEMTWHLI